MEGWMELRPFDHVRLPSVTYGTPQSYPIDHFLGSGQTSFALQYTADAFSHAPLQMYLPTHVKLQPCAPGQAVFLGGASGRERLGPVMPLPPSGWVTGHFSAAENAWHLNLSDRPGGSALGSTVTVPATPWDTVSFYNLPSDMRTNYLVFQKGPGADAYARDTYLAGGMHGAAPAAFYDGRKVDQVAHARTEAFGTGLHHLRGQYASQAETNPQLARRHGVDLSLYF